MQLHLTHFPPEAIAFFWSRVKKTETCWLWMGSRTTLGYGHVKHKSLPKRVLAHRFSYELHFGPIPPGLLVCHHCDTPQCVKPQDFFLGSHGDNQRDSLQKGRHASLRQGPPHYFGERNPAAKLTTDDVAEIRRLWHAGTGVSILAVRFRMTKNAIRNAATGRTWATVPAQSV